MTNLKMLTSWIKLSAMLLTLAALPSYAISLPSYDVIINGVNKKEVEEDISKKDIKALLTKVQSCRVLDIERGITGDESSATQECVQAQQYFYTKVFDYQNQLALSRIRSDLSKYLESGIFTEDDLWHFYDEYIAERTLFEQYVKGSHGESCESLPITQYGPRRVTDCQVLDKVIQLKKAVTSEAGGHFNHFLANADWLQLKTTDPDLWCSESAEVTLPLASPCALYLVKKLIDSIGREPIPFSETSLPVVNTEYAKLPPFPVKGSVADVDKNGIDDVVQRYILHKAPYSVRKQYLLSELSKSLQRYSQEGVASKIEAVSVLRDVGACWNHYYPDVDLMTPVSYLTLRLAPKEQQETMRKDVSALISQARREPSCSLDLTALPEDQVGVEYRHLEARDVNNNGIWDDIDTTLREHLSANEYFPDTIRNAIVRYVRAQQDLLQAAVSGAVDAVLEPAIKMEICLQKLVQHIDLYNEIKIQDWVYSSTHRVHLREVILAQNMETVQGIYEKLEKEEAISVCR